MNKRTKYPGSWWLAMIAITGLLSGCAVGEGVAHIVKLTAKAVNGKSSDDEKSAASTPKSNSDKSPAAPKTADPQPTPTDAAPINAALSRADIKVESLPPPK